MSKNAFTQEYNNTRSLIFFSFEIKMYNYYEVL